MPHFTLRPQIPKWLSRLRARQQPNVPPETIESDEPPFTASNPEESVSDDLLFPIWPPVNPREILSRRKHYREQLAYRRYRAPEMVFEDSPLFALYRLYEWIMAGHTINMRNELELFWWTRAPVSSIPDPGEQGDPERYAVLSCIPALIVESFNERNRQGLRRAEPHSILSLEEQLEWAATPEVLESEPGWTEGVAPLKECLHIPHELPDWPELDSMDDFQASEAFKKKNILIMTPHIHFV